MGEVNSYRESRASEGDFELSAPAKVRSRPRKTAAFLGLRGRISGAEKVSSEGVLAEGEVLSTNPLFYYSMRYELHTGCGGCSLENPGTLMAVACRGNGMRAGARGGPRCSSPVLLNIYSGRTVCSASCFRALFR